MTKVKRFLLAGFIGLLIGSAALAGPVSTAVRETAEHIMSKFGRGAAGQTIDEIAEATSKVVAQYGSDAIPFLRSSGHQGFAALQQAGTKGPDVIKLFVRKGGEAIWVISEPKKLSIFLKHGDSAADALLKHPGIADTLIGRYGDDAVGALNSVSKQSAQRLAIVADEGLLTATAQGTELLPVIRRYGDGAMDFIWRNKGALTVATVLASFLVDPEAYISGAKKLIVDPIIGPIAQGTNWTLIIAGVLGIVFMPFVVRRFAKARSTFKENNREVG